MHRAIHPFVVPVLLLVAFVAVASGLARCAGVRDSVNVNVVGVDPLPGEGVEKRFGLRLRVQNPNDSPVDYSRMSIELELNDKPFASGVSDHEGSVPPFGETLLGIPVSVSAFAVVQQALTATEGHPAGNVPYVLRGKLVSEASGTVHFLDRGRLTLPDSGAQAR